MSARSGWMRLGLGGIGICLLSAGPALPAVMSHGPLAAAVTDNSAKIWVRTNGQTGSVFIRYWVTWPNYTDTAPIASDSLHDFTVAVAINNLLPSTTYNYTVIVEGVDQLSSPYPKFKTFPSASSEAPFFKFGLLADLNALRDAPALAGLAAENPAFVVILGDYDHRDPGNVTDENGNPDDTASVLAPTRKMHRDVRDVDAAYCPGEGDDCPGDELQTYVFNSFPVINVWDDHDYCCNNSDREFDQEGSDTPRPTQKLESLQAHREYWRSYPLANPNPGQGLWHKFSYGGEVEVYVLDLRFKRDDLAFGSDICGSAPRNMLAGGSTSGTDQKTWLKQELAASTANWKFLISSSTWNRTMDKFDSWFSYRCEQDELLNHIVGQNIPGVVIISGDIHTAGAVDDGTNAKCPEMSVPKTNYLGATCGFPFSGSCGDWKCDSDLRGCLQRDGGPGFGIVEVDPVANTAKLRTVSYTGGNPPTVTFSETLNEGNMCSAP